MRRAHDTHAEHCDHQDGRQEQRKHALATLLEEAPSAVSAASCASAEDCTSREERRSRKAIGQRSWFHAWFHQRVLNKTADHAADGHGSRIRACLPGTFVNGASSSSRLDLRKGLHLCLYCVLRGSHVRTTPCRHRSSPLTIYGSALFHSTNLYRGHSEAVLPVSAATLRCTCVCADEARLRRYGAQCYRKNPQHWVEFDHPHQPPTCAPIQPPAQLVCAEAEVRRAEEARALAQYLNQNTRA